MLRWKVFAYIYAGLYLPSIPLLILGAAMGGVVPNIPEWSAGYDQNGVGGVVYQMLLPAGGFGKFIMVLLALSVTGNIVISVYSVALNLQMLLPWFTKVPRFLFTAATIALIIPLAIEAAAQWETSLENFLAIIGYWAGCFDAVVITELVVFRRMDFSTFDHAIWNVGRKLPSGLAAIGASVISLGLVVPGISEVWYTGPIAQTTGDIGFEMAFVVTALAYLPLRWLEIRYRGHI
jgi:purine-cytosine permease-like protein